MIPGGVASVIYRDPRFTRDIDIVLELRPANVARLQRYPLHAWAFGRRQRVQVEDLGVWVASIEYVILRKLEYFRASGSDRHLRDVAMMLRISGELVDATELARWTDQLGLREAADEARRYVPPDF